MSQLTPASDVVYLAYNKVLMSVVEDPQGQRWRPIWDRGTPISVSSAERVRDEILVEPMPSDDALNFLYSLVANTCAVKLYRPNQSVVLSVGVLAGLNYGFSAEVFDGLVERNYVTNPHGLNTYHLTFKGRLIVEVCRNLSRLSVWKEDPC